MGSGEKKPGFVSNNWLTIALIGVLVILAIVLVWILKTGGFERFERKRKPELKPSTPTGQQFHGPNDQPRLELVDSRLRTLAKLSRQRYET